MAAGLLHGEGDAEVGDQRGSVLEPRVLRLDAAVNHALAVGVVQRGGNLTRQPQGFLHGELSVARETGAQRLARDA